MNNEQAREALESRRTVYVPTGKAVTIERLYTFADPQAGLYGKGLCAQVAGPGFHGEWYPISELSLGAQPTDSMLAKVRALLAKAEDPAATKPESEAFMAKATELMAKYGIERALLAATDPTTDKVGDRVITVPAPYSRAKMLLLYSIADALGVKAVLRNAKVAGTQELHLFGMESDMERVDMLFTTLLLQCLRFMEQDSWGNYFAESQPKKWKRDYIEGFRAQVRERLTAAERRAQQQAEAERTSGPSVALVLVSRQELAQRAMEAAYPSRKTRSSSRRAGVGYTQGVRAGMRADLGGTRIQNSRRSVTA